MRCCVDHQPGTPFLLLSILFHFLQMKDHHSERCNYTSGILNELIANKDEEALKVVVEAAKEGITGTF